MVLHGGSKHDGVRNSITSNKIPNTTDNAANSSLGITLLM